jgi:hypothetical protein
VDNRRIARCMVWYGFALLYDDNNNVHYVPLAVSQRTKAQLTITAHKTAHNSPY